MVFPIWRKLPDIVQELLDNAHQFDFFQALLILEQYLHHNHPQNVDWFTQVRLLPAGSLAFPAADIQKCDIDENYNFSLCFNFMGYFGVDSPLPQYFLHLTALENEASQRLRCFLTLFNQAIYRLLYLAWKKSRLHLESSQDRYWQYLLALSGIKHEKSATDEYATVGLIGARMPNRLTLQMVIENFLEDVVVTFKEHQVTWEIIPDKMILGKNQMRLGNNIIVGEKFLTAAQQLIIQLELRSYSCVKVLLPLSSQGKRFWNLLLRIIPPHLKFTLHYLYPIDTMIHLGESVELGLNTRLGSIEEQMFLLSIPARHDYANIKC